MIRFDYDPQLVEQATFLAARRDADKECALHERLDPLYAIPDAELRLKAFRSAYGQMFRHLGLDQIVPEYIRGFRHIVQKLNRCLVREAERSRAQNVDLYTDKSGVGSEKVLIIAVCPDFLLDGAHLGAWLFRQLQHVEDMLDESFGYDRSLPADTTAQQNLIRDRYAVLWDTYVEGRLLRAGKIDSSGVENLWRAFRKAFAIEDPVSSYAHFQNILNAEGLTHRGILAWASGTAQSWGNVEGEGENNEQRRGNEVCVVL